MFYLRPSPTCADAIKAQSRKCVFGVQKGKVLGCLVLEKGIEVNPDKINVIIHMKPLQSRKEVQRLTGRIRTLNRLMSKLAERSLPFFCSTQGLWQFPVGARIASSFRCTERSHIEVAHIDMFVAESTAHLIRLHHAHNGKWIPRARKGNMQKKGESYHNKC
jgi:hypothetical protein